MVFVLATQARERGHNKQEKPVSDYRIRTRRTSDYIGQRLQQRCLGAMFLWFWFVYLASLAVAVGERARN